MEAQFYLAPNNILHGMTTVMMNKTKVHHLTPSQTNATTFNSREVLKKTLLHQAEILNVTTSLQMMIIFPEYMTLTATKTILMRTLLLDLEEMGNHQAG